MACDCTFEPKINVECVLELVRIVRSGELITAKAEVLQHAGCLVGCLGAYIGEQTDPSIYASLMVDQPCTLEECCDEVEASLGGVDVGATAINPALLALLIKLAELLFKKYLG